MFKVIDRKDSALLKLNAHQAMIADVIMAVLKEMAISPNVETCEVLEAVATDVRAIVALNPHLNLGSKSQPVVGFTSKQVNPARLT